MESQVGLPYSVEFACCEDLKSVGSDLKHREVLERNLRAALVAMEDRCSKLLNDKRRTGLNFVDRRSGS